MGVMVTDCCDALINSVKAVYPSAGHVLCRWHMYMNLAKNLKGKVISAEDSGNIILKSLTSSRSS
jgi:transposase-like protein